jgi:hypothetical protein
MNLFAKVAVSAAAVALLAVVGWAALGLTNGSGVGAVPTPTPTPSASVAATPVPPRNGSTNSVPTKFSVPFTYTVPTNWTDTVHSTAQFDLIDETQPDTGYYGISAYSEFHFYKDPCHPSAGFINATPETGLTPAQVAAQVAKWNGFQMSSPVPASVGGASGVSLDFHYTRDSTGCDSAGQLRTLEANGHNYDEFYGDKMQMRYVIVSVGGKTLLLEVWAYQTSLTDRLPALQRVLESIHFN